MRPRSFLHIQSRGEQAVRVVPLATDVIRIGRSPLCEVRLPGPRLADVEGYLRRRGRSWYLQPAGSRSRILINQSVLDEQVILPNGALFSIGEHALEIRSEPVPGTDAPAGSFIDPIIVETSVPVVTDVEPSAEPPTPAIVEPEAASHPAGEDAADRLAKPAEGAPPRPRQQPIPPPGPHWRDTLERSDRWLRETRHDRPGATGWNPPKTGPTPSRPPIEPRPTASFRDAGRRPEPPRSETPPTDHLPPWFDFATPTHGSEPPVPPSVPGDPPFVSGSAPPAPDKPARVPNEAWLDPEDVAGRAAWDASDPSEIASPPPGCLSTSFDGLDVEKLTAHEVREPAPFPAPLAMERAPEAEASDTPEGREPRPARSEELEPVVPAVEPAGSAPSRRTEAEPETEAPPELVATVGADECRSEFVMTIEPENETAPVGAIVPSIEGLPTIAMILAAHRAATPSDEPPPAPRPARKPAVRPIPLPSDAVAPPTLVLQGRWPGAPLLLFVLAIGVAGVGLSGAWVQDEQAAALVLDRLVDAPANGPPAPPLDAMPHTAWWSTTADHLYERGLLLRLSADAGDRELGRDLVDLAEHASPWHSGVAALQLADSVRGGTSSPPSAVSSRDIVALAESARVAFRARDLDRAVSRLAEAAEMALRTDLHEMSPARAASSERSPRWLLPQEDLFWPICQAAFEQTLVPAEQLFDRLPAYGPLRLTAARLARGGSSGGAERWLTRVLALGADPPPGGSPQAHRAAKAEALALLERWADAQAGYEALLEERCPPRLEAACWANLAAIYARGNDLNRMNLARRQARRLGIDVAAVVGGASAGGPPVRTPAAGNRPR